MRNRTLFAVTILMISILLMNACGGGKTSNENPNPNPNPTKSSTPVLTTLLAVNDVQNQGLVVTSGPGAFEPNATVHIFDPALNNVSGTADVTGGFNMGNDEFPLSFTIAIGTTLTITQVAPGKTESEPVTVVIQDIAQLP